MSDEKPTFGAAVKSRFTPLLFNDDGYGNYYKPPSPGQRDNPRLKFAPDTNKMDLPTREQLANAALARATGMAKEYRDFWAAHPTAALAVGFTPFVGQMVGIADAAAAGLDDRADALEKGLSTAGILPLGKALPFLGKLTGLSGMGGVSPILSAVWVGPEGIKRATKAGRADELLHRGIHPETGKEMALIPTKVRVKPEHFAKMDVDNASFYGTKWDEMVQENPFRGMGEEYNVDTFLRKNMTDEAGRFVPNPSDHPVPYIEAGALDELGMFGTRKGRRSKAHKEQVGTTLAHEGTHVAQEAERQAGTFGPGLLGTSPAESGWLGYMRNQGEEQARVSELMNSWDIEDIKAISPQELQLGVRKAIESAIEHGTHPSMTLRRLKDPRIARQWIETARDEGLNPDIGKAHRRGYPRWSGAQASPDKGEWGASIGWKELVDLDPNAESKARTAIGRGRLSSRKFNQRHVSKEQNYPRAMMLDKDIEPAVVSVVFDPKLKKWKAKDVDGTVRALAARQVYGNDTQVRTIFRPDLSDPVTRDAVTNPKFPFRKEAQERDISRFERPMFPRGDNYQQATGDEPLDF